MPIPCNNGISIPTLETDPCNGERIGAGCVVDSGIYSELSLSANATQQEINQAMYLAYLNLKATTDNIDATVSGLDGSETKIEAGDNVEITGSGTTVNPYIINSPVIDSRPYKVYTALLTQTGTNAPVATVLEDTLGGTVVFSYDAVGSYTATLTGAFVLNKTWVSITSAASADVTVTAGRSSDNTVNIKSFLSGTLTNSIMSPASFEIRVYN